MAAWVAAGWVRTHVVEVVPCDGRRVRGAIRYLDSVARSLSRRGLGRGGERGRGAVLADAVEGLPGRLACLATHGRPQPPAGFRGRVPAGAQHRPAVLVGPMAREVTAVDAPIVVAVDGTDGDGALVPVALGWAAPVWGGGWMSSPWPSLPAPDSRPGRNYLGRAEPERYLDSMAARAEAQGSRSGPT